MIDVDVHAARHEIRDALAESGAVFGTGGARGYPEPPIETPFGTAEPMEGDAIAIHALTALPRDRMGFIDGVQRFTVEGWVGVAPVVRAQVGAAAMVREGRTLAAVHTVLDEFVVTPRRSLPDGLVDRLETSGFRVLDCESTDRVHPAMDLRRATGVIERERRRAERLAIAAFRNRHPDDWLVIDGGLRGTGCERDDGPVVGLIKSHETQFLAGVDLERALTLPEGYRTSVFRRHDGDRESLPSWYIRLWDWSGQHLLYGLVRLERPADATALEIVDELSGWMLAERAPVASRDHRWDRLLYGIHEAETYAGARLGTWR